MPTPSSVYPRRVAQPALAPHDAHVVKPNPVHSPSAGLGSGGAVVRVIAAKSPQWGHANSARSNAGWGPAGSALIVITNEFSGLAKGCQPNEG